MARGAGLAAALPLAAFLARAAAFSHTPELTFDNSTGKLSGLWNGVTFPSAGITSPGPAPLLGTVGYSADFVVRTSMETSDTSATGRGNPYSSEPDSAPSDLHFINFSPVCPRVRRVAHVSIVDVLLCPAPPPVSAPPSARSSSTAGAYTRSHFSST